MENIAFKILDSRFRWGIDIDDMWKYAGLPEPRSVVVPFLFSRKTHEGDFNIPSDSRRSLQEHESKDPDNSTALTSSRRDTKKLAEETAAFLKKNKVDYVRCWFPWNFFEPRIGTGYQFPLDNFVGELNKADIGIIAVIGNGYSRFLPENLQTDNIGTYVKHLTKSSAEIVRHYRDRIKVWQIENEPNWWALHALVDWRSGPIWFEPRNEEPILNALKGVVRDECSNSTIVVNLETDLPRTDWARYSKYCDIMGVDSSSGYLTPYNTNASKIRKVSKEASRSTRLPVYVIEAGYTTGPNIFGYNEKRQAKYIASACNYSFSTDEIKGMGMFRFSDSYWQSFPVQENYFGLLTEKGVPKHGWNEYMRQIRRL